MKKYLILLIICFSQTFLKSQTWPMSGAHWEYCVGGIGANFRIFEYTKDTIINSTNYQVIENLNVPPMPYLGSVYTRYSNDTVYRYVQSKEFPFLIFNAQLGDVYTTFRTNLGYFPDSTCSSTLPVKVLNIDTVNYGGLDLKRWELEDTLFNDIYTGVSYPPSKWLIVEKIGFMNDFPFTPDKAIWGNDCNLPTDIEENYHLVSYWDSTYSYINSWNCGVGINDYSSEKTLLVYPNPANDELNIFISKIIIPTHIVIYNVYGKEVYRSNLSSESTSIPIVNFSSGFYFLKCTNNDFITNKIIIINH